MDDAFYKSVLDNLHDGVYFVDRERRITYWNRGAEGLTGYESDDIVGSCCADNLLSHVTADGAELCQAGCPLVAAMEDGRPREVEAYLRHRDGHRVPVRIRVSPIRDEKGAIVGAVEVFSDNTWAAGIRRRVEDLERLALLDHLTRLPNRRFIEAAVGARLAEANRYGWELGLLFVDVDHFKQVNDTHGHLVGDRVLQMVANTLLSSVRAFDAVGRWGGEEFAVAAANSGPQETRSAGDRIRALVEQSRLDVAGRTIRVTVSVGAAVAVPGDTVASLLVRADRALYRSKAEGRNRVTLDGGP